MADETLPDEFRVKVKEKPDKTFIPHNVTEVTLRRSATIPDQQAAEAHVRTHCKNLEVVAASPPAPEAKVEVPAETKAPAPAAPKAAAVIK